MSIDFYKFNNTNYDNDGNVALLPSKAIFNIKLNGICEIEIEHPYDKDGRWKLINKDGIIKAPTPYSDGQLFGIYNIKKNFMKTGIIIQARHIFFDLVHSTVDDIRAIDKNGQDALNILFQGTKFTGHSDISSINSCYFVKDNIVSLINSDKDNTFVKRWGGEIFLNNYDIYINNKIGADYGAHISYGHNMLDLGIQENMDNIVTRIKPVAYNGRLLPDNGYVDSPLINSYRIIYEKFISMDNLKLKTDLQDSDSTNENDDGSIIFDTEAELNNAMIENCKKLFENGIDKPDITGNVKVAALENTELYKDVKGLVNISLGDTVTAYSELLDINLTTRCIGYEWNILTKKYNSIEIGDVVKNYFEKQSDISNKVDKLLTGNGDIKSDMLAGVIDATKTKFKAMRDIAKPQEVRAMIFEDKIKGSKTYGALCLGSMGLEIANTRTPDDKDWNWNTFIGGGYVVADWLIGKLKTVLIENMDGSFSIDLNKTGGALFKNNGKKAINISNNSMNFYDWFDNEKQIGGLTSVVRNSDNSKALIQLNNTKQSALSLSYEAEKNNSSFFPYIEFDNYNILNNHKPICIYNDTSLLNNSLYFGNNDQNQLFNASSDYMCIKTKHGFGIADKDSGNWTFLVDSLNKAIKAFEWNTGNQYFYVSPTDFNFSNKLFSAGNAIAVTNNLNVNKDLNVSGKKNRIVKTAHYGILAQNAYETCEAYFGDIGRAKLKNRKCIIRLDKKFLETVNTDIPYEIFISPYGNGNVWVDTKKMYKQYVIVEGTADIEFAYEIKAKQKDYENIRLEEYRKDVK